MSKDRAAARRHTTLSGTPIFKVKGKARKKVNKERCQMEFALPTQMYRVWSNLPHRRKYKLGKLKHSILFHFPLEKGEWLFVVDSHEHYVVWHITFRSQGRSHLKVITGEGEETFPSSETGIPQPGQTSRLTGHEPCPAAKCDVRCRESFLAKRKNGKTLKGLL